MESLSERIEEAIKGFAEYIYGLSPHNYDFKIKKNNYDVDNFIEFKLMPLIEEKEQEFIKKLKEDIFHQITEWELYEKRFPHKETKWNRINVRLQNKIDKLAGEKLI